jgi:tetratricopeptide (TPR) repeat protein
MNRWAIAAIPLVLCLVLGEAVVRQWLADQAFRLAKQGIEKYEEESVSSLKGKGARPSPELLRGDTLKKAVRLQPHSAEYRNYLGRYYQALATNLKLSDEQREELAQQAVREHEKSVELDPLNGVYRAYLAQVQRAMARHYEARAMDASLSDEERMRLSARAVEYYGKAIANFEEAISLNRSNTFIRNLYEAYRGRLWRGSGETR